MLRVRGLAKGYPGAHGAVHAVKGIDFDVAPGEFFTLLGPSGCGKTTTLRCVAGLERPDAGEIAIGEEVVARAADGLHVPVHKRDIGMVFQSYAIWPHLSVFENVAYPLRVARRRPPRAEIESAVGAALDLVGMADMAGRSATKLSGGQQQRVALARAIVRRPKLLLLDEPLSNLDAKLREQMRIELKELMARVAITALYVTHDQAEALAMSDRVAVMRDGLIVQQAAPRLMYDRPESAFVASFLGSANFLPARLAEILPDRTGVFRLASDTGALRLPVADGLAVGDAVDIVVRPEDAEVLTEPPGDTTDLLRGRVGRTVFQGGVTECAVAVGPVTVRTTVHRRRELAPGQDIWLRIRPASCLAFRRTTG
jgi:iron(III) transport system ATP-binding protein